MSSTELNTSDNTLPQVSNVLVNSRSKDCKREDVQKLVYSASTT